MLVVRYIMQAVCIHVVVVVYVTNDLDVVDTEVIANLPVVVVNVCVIRMDRVVVYIRVSIRVRRVVVHLANAAEERSASCVAGTRHIIVFS